MVNLEDVEMRESNTRMLIVDVPYELDDAERMFRKLMDYGWAAIHGCADDCDYSELLNCGLEMTHDSLMTVVNNKRNIINTELQNLFSYVLTEKDRADTYLFQR